MISFSTGYPFGEGRVYHIELPRQDGTSYVVQHRAEVPLSWGQLARIASDEFTAQADIQPTISNELIGIEDGSPVRLIYKGQ